MIKKFIIRGVSKKFTGIQKLKAQKVPKMERSGAEAAEAQFTKIFGDKPQFAGFSGSKRFGATATGTELAAKDLAVQTSEKSFFKILRKGLKRQSETKFIKKAYTTANVQSVGVFQRTLKKFTGKSGISPFVHKPTPIQFIKSKRFKKGLPTGVSGQSMGWAPKTFSKGERITFAKRKAGQEFLHQHPGKVYFDPKTQQLAPHKAFKSELSKKWLKEQKKIRKEIIRYKHWASSPKKK